MVDTFPHAMKLVRARIATIKPDERWVSNDVLLEYLGRAEGGALSSISYISESLDNLNFQTHNTMALIHEWNDAPEGVFAVDLCRQILSLFGFSDERDEGLCSAVLVAAALADVPNDLPYHNELHSKKVIFHAARMISAHNFIFSGGPRAFNKDFIAKMLISACIHDLGHTGHGNIEDRQYHMAKMEEGSFNLARPYLESLGVCDSMMADIRVMLIGTDASPFGDPISPSQQIRRAYAYHFGDDDDLDDDLKLSDTLEILLERDDLALMCMILHEADLMNSIGVDYEMTVQESIAVSLEIGGDATPEDTLLFLEKTCCDELYTDSGRYLGQKNLDVIKAKLLDDYKEGNKVYRS